MSSKSLLKFFPPPKFLDTPCAGLSMSDKHIRAIQFNATVGKYSIKTYAELLLPEGAIVGGRVNEKEKIVTILKELKQKTGIEYVRVSIPEEKAYLFEIEIPLVDPKDVKGAIEFKIEDNVPWPTDKVVFDYVITEKNEQQGHIKAVVCALPSKFVDIYMDLFVSSGLTPFVFEIESQAIARAVLSDQDTGTYLIAHFHKDKIGLCIVSAKVVHFTSTINPSENWQNNLALVAGEIKKVIAYWNTNRSEAEEKNSISKVFISGEVVDETAVAQFSSLLRVETELGNVWKNVFDVEKNIPGIPFFESLKYAPAIGLALPSDSLI